MHLAPRLFPKSSPHQFCTRQFLHDDVKKQRRVESQEVHVCTTIVLDGNASLGAACFSSFVFCQYTSEIKLQDSGAVSLHSRKCLWGCEKHAVIMSPSKSSPCRDANASSSALPPPRCFPRRPLFLLTGWLSSLWTKAGIFEAEFIRVRIVPPSSLKSVIFAMRCVSREVLSLQRRDYKGAE